MNTKHDDIDIEVIAASADYEAMYKKIVRKMAAKLYRDPAHFIHELLQNAEDSLSNRPSKWKGSRKVTFYLKRDQLVFSHCGEEFTAGDVEAICAVFESTKTDSQIGQFGLGFKSIYVFTDKPKIYSGNLAFSIAEYCKPQREKLITGLKKNETRFVLPIIDSGERSSEENRESIKLGLSKLSQNILLFLREIDEIEWKTYDGEKGIIKRNEPKRVTSKKFVREVILSGSGNTTSWKVFKRAVSFNGKEIGNVEIAFKLRSKNGKKQIERQDTSLLSVYFPTHCETRLGFLLHGPFEPTPDRGNITEGSDQNSHLIRETGELIVEALLWMSKNKQLTVEVLSCLPINPAIEDELIYEPLFERVKQALQEEKLIPNHLHGSAFGYEASTRLKIAETNKVRELINSRKIILDYFENECSAWVSAGITRSGKYHDLYEYFTSAEGLNIDVIYSANLFRNTSAEFFRSQEEQWIKRLYKFLSEQSDVEYLRIVPFVRLSTGEHTFPNPDKVFLSDPTKLGVATIKKSLLNDDGQKLFERLGFREPDLIDIVIKTVLNARYDKDAVTEDLTITKKQYADDISLITDAYHSGSAKMKIELEKYNFIKSQDSDGNNGLFLSPRQLYLPTDNLQKLFKGISGIYFVDDVRCLKPKRVQEMLVGSGVSDCLRAESVSGTMTRKEKSELRSDHGCSDITEQLSFEDLKMNGLNEVIVGLQKLKPGPRKARSRLIWDCMREYGREHAKYSGTYSWLYYKPYTCHFPAHFIRLLNDRKWVADSNGKLMKPAQIEFEALTASGWKHNRTLCRHIEFLPSGTVEAIAKLGFSTGFNTKFEDAIRTHSKEDLEQLFDEQLDVIMGRSDGQTGYDDEEEADEDTPADNGGDGENPETRSQRRKATATIKVSTGAGDPKVQQKRMLAERRAIEVIKAEESSLKVMPPGNPGFDLVEVKSGKRVRWIEVKSMTGSWDGRFASMTRPQIEEALKRWDSYWLYVVENVWKANRKIYRIPNPAGLATQFQFRHNWKKFSEPRPKQT